MFWRGFKNFEGLLGLESFVLCGFFVTALKMEKMFFSKLTIKLYPLSDPGFK
jgi:hypothetical protein